MAVFYGIILTLASGGCLWAFLEKPEIWPWVLIPYGLMIGYQVVMLTFYPSKRFQTTGFRLTDQVFEIRRGIWWKTWHLVPLPRLQHADIVSGPLERWFGLATLVLHTAGSHDSVLLVEGIQKARAIELRDHLVELGGENDGL